MRRSLIMLVLITFLVGADDPKKEDPAKKELELMQGAWAVIKHESNGTQQTDEQIKQAKIKLEVKGDRYTVTFDGKQASAGKLKLDPTKKPKHIDAFDDAWKGEKFMPGIYEIDKDEMTVCFSAPDDERPAKFTTKEGPGKNCITYKKMKE